MTVWAKGSYHLSAEKETTQGRIDPGRETKEPTDFQRANWSWASHWWHQTLQYCGASVKKPDRSFCRWCNGNCLWLTQLPLQPSTISGCLIWNRWETLFFVLSPLISDKVFWLKQKPTRRNRSRSVLGRSSQTEPRMPDLLCSLWS